MTNITTGLGYPGRRAVQRKLVARVRFFPFADQLPSKAESPIIARRAIQPNDHTTPTSASATARPLDPRRGNLLHLAREGHGRGRSRRFRLD